MKTLNAYIVCSFISLLAALITAAFILGGA